MINTSKMQNAPATSSRLTALEARQADLEKRIAELERAAIHQMPQPWTAPTDRAYPAFPTPMDPTPALSDQCYICGIKWKDATHYICRDYRYPNRITVTCGGASAHITASEDSIVTTFGGPSMATEQLPHFAGSTTQAVGQTPTHLPQ